MKNRWRSGNPNITSQEYPAPAREKTPMTDQCSLWSSLIVPEMEKFPEETAPYRQDSRMEANL
jgi:hypothetical protein